MQHSIIGKYLSIISSPLHGRARQRNTGNVDTAKRCPRCGKEPHCRESCPAKDAVCSKCGKRNHFAAVCRTKIPVTSEVTTASPADVAFLDYLAPTEAGRAWLTPIELCGQVITLKIDTGAEVTAISEETHQQVGPPALHTTDRKLFGPSTQPLQVLGTFEGEFKHKGRISKQGTYVVKGLKTNLIGLPAISALQLVARIDGIQTLSDNSPKPSTDLETSEKNS